MKAISNSSKGFTLIELMVALAATSILAACIYATYITQLKSHTTRKQVVEMQQNLRAAMQLIEREVRMAGYDPRRTAGAGVTTMLANTFTFDMDITENGALGDPNESVSYTLATDAGGNQFLGRNANDGNGLQPLAVNIDALNFVYLDNAGNITTDPLRVSSIQVTMVARSGRVVPVLFHRQTDIRFYRNQQNQIILPPQNDNFRRMIITSEIQCRNL
jgi:type IV pilus assembly protein PilW